MLQDREGVTLISIPPPYQQLDVKPLSYWVLYNLIFKALSMNSLVFLQYLLSTYHTAQTLGIED